MEKKLAVSISNHIDKWNLSKHTIYNIYKIETVGSTLHDFHQWSNGKPFVAGYQVTKHDEKGYYLLFIDWHRNDNYYLVVYMHDKSTTVAELQRTVDNEGNQELVWNYSPLKRDGKNDQRKAYFKQVFGSTTVHIPLPKSPKDVEMLLDHLFALSRNRLRADRIVDKFNFSIS